MQVVYGGGLKKTSPATASHLHHLRASRLAHDTYSHTSSEKNMEDERAATNLGPDVDQGIAEESPSVPKQPKRRFVGRKTAEKTSGQPVDPNSNIEDSSTIQGVRSPHAHDADRNLSKKKRKLKYID